MCFIVHIALQAPHWSTKSRPPPFRNGSCLKRVEYEPVYIALNNSVQ